MNLVFLIVSNASGDDNSFIVSEKNDPPNDPSPWVAIARYSEIGFIIPAAVAVGYFFGRLFDYWLHTRWLYLAGLIFGAIVGFAQMIRMALSSFNDKS